MRLLIIFVLMLSNSFASEVSDIKNLVINKELKNYSDITFLDIKNKELNLNDYKGNLVLLNFWATWCAPCKDEMPSLDLLAESPNLDNLKPQLTQIIMAVKNGIGVMPPWEGVLNDQEIEAVAYYIYNSINK